MRYKFIKEERSHYGVNRLCRVLKVSRSGYHKWVKKKTGKRATENENLAVRIQEIFEANRKVYGWRRIVRILKKEGLCYNHKRIRRIMKANNLRAVQRMKYRPLTTDSRGNKLIFPNLLKYRTANRPEEVLAADITYIRTEEGFIYLSVVIDLFTRQVIGYAVDDNMKADLVYRSVLNAFRKINPNKVKIFHSDRGKQFSSLKLTELMRFYKIEQSMSRKGNCYDNSIVESFFHTLKTESIYREKLESLEMTKLKIFDYIELFYNKKRIHSALDYLSPVDFKDRFYLNRNVS